MKTININNIITDLKLFIKSLFKAIIPYCKLEWLIFSFFFTLYGVCGLWLALNYEILDTITENAGSYLGYDNLYHYKTRGGGMLDVSHPILNAVHLVKYIISIPFKWILGAKGHIIFLVLLTNYLISTALLVVFKYLKQITSLPIFRCIILTLFCGLFFTVIILSFTIETYPFSFLFLTLSIYILSLEYQKFNKFSSSNVIFLEFFCGGITITNAVKPLSALMLNKWNLKSKIFNIIKAAFPFIIFVAIIFLFYFIINLKNQNNSENSLISTTLGLIEYFNFDKGLLKKVFIDYWGSSILVAELTPQTIYTETVLRPNIYNYFWQYILIFSLLFIFIVSLIINRKNTLVKLIILYILVDIVIHFGFRYGLNEAIIFGGHWLFLIPMCLGWLYKHISSRKVLSIAFDIYFIIFTLALLYNNTKEIYCSFFN